MRAITLTHNDLDGMGSLLMLMIKFRPVEHFFTNYYDMEQAVSDVINYKREHDADTLLIADLSFSDHKELLERLAMVFENKVFLVDHHMYPDGFWDSFSFKHVVDTSRCATRILFEDLKLGQDIKDTAFSEDTANFVHFVDTWDRWCDTDPDFNKAMMYNELFISLKKDNRSLIEIAKDQIRNRFSIFKHVDDFAKLYMNGYEAHKEKLKSEKGIWRIGDIVFVFGWDYMPKLTQDLYNEGVGIVVGIKYSIFKVRINQHKGYSEETINALRRHLTGMDEFCHLYAFTYAKNFTKEKDIVNECRKIADFWLTNTTS